MGATLPNNSNCAFKHKFLRHHISQTTECSRNNSYLLRSSIIRLCRFVNAVKQDYLMRWQIGWKQLVVLRYLACYLACSRVTNSGHVPRYVEVHQVWNIAHLAAVKMHVFLHNNVGDQQGGH